MTPARKILIIDDDAHVVALIAAYLHAAGYDTLTAADPVQGLMSAHRQAPTVILLDVHMPAGGGMDLLEKLRSSGRTRAIPVVVITADADRALEEKVLAKGAAAFVMKPVDGDALVAKIKQLTETEAG